MHTTHDAYRAARASGRLRGEVIDPERSWRALSADWRALYQADPAATVFQHPSWFRAWSRATGDATLAFLVRSVEDGAPRALLVMRSSSMPVARGLLNPATFGVYGQPAINHAGLLCDPRMEDAALDALAEVLKDEVEWYRLHFARVSDPRIHRLARRLADDGFELEVRDDEPSPTADLPDGWEAFLANLSGDRRRELRRRERRASEAGLRHAHAGQDDFPEYLEAFHRLHRLRFGDATTKHRAFHDTLFRCAFRAGLLHTNGIWDGDRLVAVQLGFVDRAAGTYHGCQGGWDPDYGRLGIGILVRAEAIRHAIRLGLRRFDMGRKEQPYKNDLADGSVPMAKLRITRPGTLRRITRALGRD